jgi:hypothetical protein
VANAAKPTAERPVRDEKRIMGDVPEIKVVTGRTMGIEVEGLWH